LVPDRHLTRLFLRRFSENDVISPDGDRLQFVAQACGMLITGGLFVSFSLLIPYLHSPYPLPSRTAANMIRVQFLYSAWSMTVMALVAVSVWDAVSLDRRDTEILGPLPLPRGVVRRAKIAALLVVAAGVAAALNVVPALMHPIGAVSRLRPNLLQVGTLVAAHLASTTAAAAFGFAVVLAMRELLHAVLGTAGFRRIAVLVRAALVVMLVTLLLLIPAMAFRVANLWMQGAIDATLLPPMWFAGLHDLMSGHIWAQLPRPELPPSVAASERAFEFLYQSRRPLLRELGLGGGATFLLVLIASAVAYLWNNRRLPDPDVLRTAQRGYLRNVSDAMALRLVARRPLVRAGLFFTMRVLARSVQNRLSIGIPLAIAIAVSMVSLPAAGMTSDWDFSRAPVAVLAIQLLLVTALAIGFRHSIRVPADLRARWMFHLIRPAPQGVYLRGVKRAAVVKLVLPALLVLLPFHLFALGRQVALMHFAFGLLSALVLREAFLIEYRRLPFAANYVPDATITTYGGIYIFICLMGVYTVAWLEHMALRSTSGTLALFVVTLTSFVTIRAFDLWQRRNPHEVDLDELVEPPTLRLGLTD
jgi:hypothetical protein